MPELNGKPGPLANRLKEERETSEEGGVDFQRLGQLRLFEGSTKGGLRLQEIGSYDGHAEFYGNQYAQMGELVDMWADLIEGYADKTEAFWEAFIAHFKSRGLKGVGPYSGTLTATGLFAPYRDVTLIARGVVKIPIYIATQGKDLYISWRSFIQGQISLVKIVVWLIVCVIIALPFGIRQENLFFGNTTTRFDDTRCLTSAVIIAVVTGILAAAYGFFYRQGDWQALWREPINELHYDDVASLSNAVHNSLIAAADQIGIDTTKLQQREPFYNPRGRKRRI